MTTAKSIADNFYPAAQAFCCEIESLCSKEPVQYDRIIEQLMQIYLSALRLPDVEPDTTNAVQKECHMSSAKFGNLDLYWEVFNPYEQTELVAGSLTDDIFSIREDLLGGCRLYEMGFINDALWQWRFDFRSHWSFHAADAIRAINQIIMDVP